MLRGVEGGEGGCGLVSLFFMSLCAGEIYDSNYSRCISSREELGGTGDGEREREKIEDRE